MFVRHPAQQLGQGLPSGTQLSLSCCSRTGNLWPYADQCDGFSILRRVMSFKLRAVRRAQAPPVRNAMHASKPCKFSTKRNRREEKKNDKRTLQNRPPTPPDAGATPTMSTPGKGGGTGGGPPKRAVSKKVIAPIPLSLLSRVILTIVLSVHQHEHGLVYST
jgi:hypothetical protein